MSLLLVRKDIADPPDRAEKVAPTSIGELFAQACDVNVNAASDRTLATPQLAK
jgi:hypothetical protein